MSALCRPARSGNGLEEHRHRWSLSIRINLCRRFLRRHTFETATFSLRLFYAWLGAREIQPATLMARQRT